MDAGVIHICGKCLQNATEELARLEQSFDYVKKQLFDRMHNTVRNQLFHVGTEKPLLGASNGIKAAAAADKVLPHPEDASTAASSDSNGSNGSGAEEEQQQQEQLQFTGSPEITSRL
jgi:hypothetical protein